MEGPEGVIYGPRAPSEADPFIRDKQTLVGAARELHECHASRALQARLENAGRHNPVVAQSAVAIWVKRLESEFASLGLQAALSAKQRFHTELPLALLLFSLNAMARLRGVWNRLRIATKINSAAALDQCHRQDNRGPGNPQGPILL